MNAFIWIGIIICLTQSAIFSGLNLAFFSISMLRLEIEAEKNNPAALKILDLRRNSNFLLVTILWGNVSVNVLLALLSNSVLAGITAFLFSTIVITIVGEIIPQAYFSRHAMKVAALLSPVIRMYQVLLYPVAKPTALILDKWLGREAITFFEEKELRDLISMHMESKHTEIDEVEGIGALNFLALDDLPIKFEGETVDPKSIICLPFENNLPVFPEIRSSSKDPFLILLQSSGKKWIMITDEDSELRMVLDSDRFLRDALFGVASFSPYWHCHRPIIIKDEKTPLGQILPALKVHAQHSGDDVIDQDIIVYWGKEKKVITGSDILGRLLRGIVQRNKV